MNSTERYYLTNYKASTIQDGFAVLSLKETNETLIMIHEDELESDVNDELDRIIELYNWLLAYTH